MLKKNLHLIILYIAVCFSATVSAQDIEVVVHRGANHLAPENTVESAIAALEHGATWIELDVRRSNDGVMFNLHDDTLDRTTNGKGVLAELNSDYIETLDAGSWFSDEYKGIKVPRISYMLDQLKGKANIFFDVKRSANVEDLIQLVREKGYTENSFFWFADTEMLKQMVRLAPEMKIKVNANDTKKLKYWMTICRPAIVETPASSITPKFRRFCKKHHIKIMAALQSDAEEDYQLAIELHPDMVNIDRPEVFSKMKADWDAKQCMK